MSHEIPLELTLQMGRCGTILFRVNRYLYTFESPVSQGPGEIRGFLDRANHLLDIASKSLADVTLDDSDKPGFRRYIKRVPLGVILVIAPWKSVTFFF